MTLKAVDIAGRASKVMWHEDDRSFLSPDADVRHGYVLFMMGGEQCGHDRALPVPLHGPVADERRDQSDT
jgi:hypothetical protein